MIAKVIVDISNNEVDRIFDYLSIAGTEIGHRVLVPFGHRNIEGYVIGLSDRSDYDNSKLKAIIRPLDEYPVITKEMLNLMEFMKVRYHLRVVDILRLFIPAQMRGGRVKELTRLYVNVSEEYRGRDVGEFIKASSLRQLELYAYLLNNDGAFLSYINENFSAAACNNLLERGIIKQEKRQVNRTPYKSLSEIDNEFVLTSEQENAVRTICGGSGGGYCHPERSTKCEAEGSYAYEEGDPSASLRFAQDDKTEVSAIFQQGRSGTPARTGVGKKFLLHGVTGSGKTEVYLRCIDKVLREGKTAILLVPEISLTPQVFSKFKSRFSDKVAILHSGLSAGERFDEWQRLLSGDALIAVGARSAVFAPLKNLGLIIIDEEHDGSYSSESNPRYITKDIAEFRAGYNDCALVLGSATPSVETYYTSSFSQTQVYSSCNDGDPSAAPSLRSGFAQDDNRGVAAQNNSEGTARDNNTTPSMTNHQLPTTNYTLIEMPNRINNTLPQIQIVNMCSEIYHGNNSLFSSDLHNALAECLEKGNQAMLFINRRGYSSFIRCTGCGYVAQCERCDVSLVLHKEYGDQLKCHYCQNRYSVPTACPQCQNRDFRRGYLGTQQVEEKIAQLFPNARTLRMDNDTTQNKDAHLNILSQFRNRQADILIGTQMIAKGHDFPQVTLVGIIDADISLHFSDYKSNERTFQLITQVSGRAGRADKAGKVYLQTYSPNHFVYKFALNSDYQAFYKKEINMREVTSFPPFSNILRVLVSGEDGEKTAQTLKAIYESVLKMSQEKKDCFSYLAYMHSPVKKIKGLSRMQILMRVKKSFDEVLQMVYNMVDENKCKGVSIFVEINPNSLS